VDLSLDVRRQEHALQEALGLLRMTLGTLTPVVRSARAV
jgi:hypothetical protein